MITQLKTSLQKALDFRDALVLQTAEAARYLASVIDTSNRNFWTQNTDDLLLVLNHDVEATVQLFAANTALASAVNAALDASGLEGIRAPATAGREDILFDGTQFILRPAQADDVVTLPVQPETVP